MQSIINTHPLARKVDSNPSLRNVTAPALAQFAFIGAPQEKNGNSGARIAVRTPNFGRGGAKQRPGLSLNRFLGHAIK
jgi:hypothetical protein